MKAKRGEIFNILFPTIIVLILFSLYDILILYGVIDGVQQSFLGAWDDIKWPEGSTISNFYWCVSMTVFKSILFHVPLLIFLALVSHFAIVEPRYNKKIFEILTIAFLLSFSFIILVGFYVELNMYSVPVLINDLNELFKNNTLW
ncbi:MAG: hypothetical protein LKJ25_10095 [Clostridia bacterium]|jgi:hypothetical protein|nr:hypothetical protein [Clostridia bacterium]